jgi:HD-like signal output (HDOD) protein
MVTVSADYRAIVLKALADLPPFSPVLSKLLASLSTDDVAFGQLATLIERDTVLSGSVLKLVNAAAYARRGQVSSIAHAISVLGLTKLRNLILGLSITRMVRSAKTTTGWSQANFNMHSVATAILTDHLAQHVSVNYPEGAFIAGLFHDIGRLLIASGLLEEHHEIQRQFEAGNRTLSECEISVIGISHAGIAALALAEWNLPSPIQSAVEFHNDPASNPRLDEEKASGGFHLAEIVCAADEVVNRLGNSIMPRPQIELDEEPFQPLSTFVGADLLEKIAESFTREYTAIRALF